MSTTTPFGPYFAKELVNFMFIAFDNAQKQVSNMLWPIFIDFLKAHWLSITILLLVVLVVAILQAMMGKWGMLGSILYHYLYYGILFIIGSIFGPEIFVANYFTIVCTIARYPFCYWVTGQILDRTDLRPEWARRRKRLH